MARWPGIAPRDPEVTDIREKIKLTCEAHEKGLCTDFEFVYGITELTAELNSLEELHG